MEMACKTALRAASTLIPASLTIMETPWRRRWMRRNVNPAGGVVPKWDTCAENSAIFAEPHFNENGAVYGDGIAADLLVAGI